MGVLQRDYGETEVMNPAPEYDMQGNIRILKEKQSDSSFNAYMSRGMSLTATVPS